MWRDIAGPAAFRARFVVVAAATVLGAVPATPARADRIAAGVHVVRGTFVPGMQPDGNSVVVEAPAGLIVIDTGRHRAHTQAVLNLAAELKAPVVAVINTHWHLDHVGGNPMVRDAHAGVRVFASGAIEGARGGFLARYRESMVGLIAMAKRDSLTRAMLEAEIAIIDAGDALMPDDRIERTATRTLAGRELTLGLATRAVTAGDVWVFDPATRTLVAGDLVTLPVPFLDTACPPGWQAALAELSALDFEVVVPGHGPPLTREQFGRWRRAFDGLLACAAGDAPRDACIDGWLRDVGDLVPVGEQAFARKLLGYYMDQNLRADPAPAATFCAE